MTQAGFKVVEIPEVLPANDRRYQWRRVNAFDFTIETHPNCPIDGMPLETIAALVSLTLPEKIRVGCCPRCGIVGYIDRPSQADIDRYYAETWMGETVEQATAISEQWARAEVSREVALLKSLPDSVRLLPVLEIGCGYGGIVRALQLAGFTSIDATEHCPARSEAVRQVFGVNVTTEIPQKRYGLIVSHHVLEHVASPSELILACASRQETGDYMIHSLPAFSAEPSMGIIFFLPHLWSFNPWALTELFGRSGYVRASMQPNTGSQLYSIVQKGSGCTETHEGVSLVGGAVKKLLWGLGLVPRASVLEWQRDWDGCVWKSLDYFRAEQSHQTFTRRIIVEPVHEFTTTSPIEIQFKDRVSLFAK